MKEVTIYTTEGCSHCHDAMEFFDANNIPYIEHSISKDKVAKKELMKKGVMSVPYIIIGDSEFREFDADKIKALLNI